MSKSSKPASKKKIETIIIEQKKAKISPILSGEQANETIGKIGENLRLMLNLRIIMENKISKLKEGFEKKAMGIRRSLGNPFEGLFRYAQASRNELTNHGKTKTVTFLNGKMFWRMSKESVELTLPEKTVIANLEANGLGELVGITKYIKKDELLKNENLREKALTIAGIKIKQSEELFYVAPSSTDEETSYLLARPVNDKK